MAVLLRVHGALPAPPFLAHAGAVWVVCLLLQGGVLASPPLGVLLARCGPLRAGAPSLLMRLCCALQARTALRRLRRLGTATLPSRCWTSTTLGSSR